VHQGARRVHKLGRGLVFVDETAQHVPPVNFRGPQVIDRWPWVSARRPKIKPAMRPRLVVVPYVGAKDALKVSSADDERPIQALARTVPTHLSQNALAFGARIGVRTILMPSERNTSSKASVNLVSRSWFRPRIVPPLGASWPSSAPAG